MGHKIENKEKNSVYKAQGKVLLIGVMVFIVLFSTSFISAFTFNETMIGYYGFNEGTGTTTYDNSSYKNNGTLLGSGIWNNITGKNGYAVNFTGNGGSRMINNRTIVTPVSYSFWINLYDYQIGDNRLFSTSNQVGGGTVSEGIGAEDGFIAYYAGAESGSVMGWNCTTKLNKNSWYHVIINTSAATTMSSTTTTIFLNGAICTTNHIDVGSNDSRPVGFLHTALGGANLLNSNFSNGSIDEFLIVNKSFNTTDIADLYNGGAGLFYGGVISYQPAISINLSTPANNSIVTTSTYNFTSYLNITGTNYSYQWKNATIKVWFSNGTQFNSTLILSLSKNYTMVSRNITNLALGNYRWNVYACYGNTTRSFCNWSNTGNNSFGVGMAITSASYNATSNPTATENFVLSGVKNTLTSSINATFYYNGTPYVAAVSIVGNDVTISKTLTIPSGLVGNMSFYWAITSFGTLGSITQNSSTYYQNVNNFTIYSCNGTTPFGLTLNFTLYDESSKARLNGSFESYFTYFIIGGDGSVFQTYNFQSINESRSNWMFCLNASGQNVSFSSTSSYYADYYDRREYIFANATIGNFTQNIPLYLSLIADTDVITVSVKNQNYDSVSGALVYIQEWNVGTNTYSTVGMFYTDSSGNGIINLELYNRWYRAIVSIDGEIVKTTDVQKLSSTTWTIDVQTGEANPYELFDSISHGLTFDNNTNITTFVWVDGSGYIQYGCLDIYNKTNTGYSLLSNECVSSVAGTINYLLPGNGEYQLVGTIYLVPTYNVSKVTDVEFVRIGTPAAISKVSPFGKVISFLFIGTAAFIGISVGSPIWGGILLILSIFLSWRMGWFNITESIFWGLISILIVILARQSRRTG